MGFFDILKGKAKEENVPPDVGQEESEITKIDEESEVGTGGDEAKTAEPEKKASEKKEPEKEDDSEKELKGKTDKKKEVVESIETKSPEVKSSKIISGGFESEKMKLDIEKVGARMEALEAWIKGYSERFSSINQQMGEIRAMNLANEKAIVKSNKESAMAVDIVKEVKPEKLRIDFQKVNMKADTVAEKLEANKQFYEEIMKEVSDIKRKEKVFMGTDALLELNEEVKKDLIEIQKTSGRVKMQTDKSEQIFIELRKGFAESQKSDEIISNLEVSYSGLKSEIERLRLDHSNVVSKSDLDDFKKTFNNKFAVIENFLLDFDQLKLENERLTQLIETVVSIAKENKNDIAEIAMSIGDDKIKSVSDYDTKLVSILTIVDSIAGQMSLVKKQLGMKSSAKIVVEPNAKKVIGKNKINLEHVKVHPEVSKPLVSQPAKVSAPVKKVIAHHPTGMTSKEGGLRRSKDFLQKSLQGAKKDVDLESVKVHPEVSKPLVSQPAKVAVPAEKKVEEKISEEKEVEKKESPVLKEKEPNLQGAGDVNKGIISKLYSKIMGNEKSVVESNPKVKKMAGKFGKPKPLNTKFSEAKRKKKINIVSRKIGNKQNLVEKKLKKKVVMRKPRIKKKGVKTIARKTKSKKSELKLKQLRLKNLEKARKVKAEKRKRLLLNLKKARRALKEKRTKHGVRKKIKSKKSVLKSKKLRLKNPKKKSKLNKLSLEPKRKKRITSGKSLEALNDSSWENSISELVHNKKNADRIIAKYKTQIKHLMKDIQENKYDPNSATSEQQETFVHMNDIKFFLEDARLKLSRLFDEAYKYGTLEEKKVLTKATEQFKEDLGILDPSQEYSPQEKEKARKKQLSLQNQSHAVQRMIKIIQKANPKLYRKICS